MALLGSMTSLDTGSQPAAAASAMSNASRVGFCALPKCSARAALRVLSSCGGRASLQATCHSAVVSDAKKAWQRIKAHLLQSSSVQ